jgi:hypothetical protein
MSQAQHALAAIEAYSDALLATELRIAFPSPAWYETFAESYLQIGGNALLWGSSFSPRLKAIFQAISQHDLHFALQVSHLRQYADLLSVAPGHADARKSLSDTLLQMIEEIDGKQELIDTFRTDLAGFRKTLQADAAVLARGIEDAAEQIVQDRAAGTRTNPRSGNRITRPVPRLHDRLPAFLAMQDAVPPLIRLNGEAQAGIGQLLTAWEPMRDKIRAVAGDLGQARKRFEASQLVEMRADVAAAEQSWKELTAVADGLSRTYGQPAPDFSLPADEGLSPG